MTEDNKGYSKKNKFDIDDEDKLLKSYENNYKKFCNYFGILLGFALIFIFIILFPYMSILEKSYSIEKKLNNILSNITQHNNNINQIKKAGTGLQHLELLLNQYPLTLEKSFINLNLVQIYSREKSYSEKVNKILNSPQNNTNLNKLNDILTHLYKSLNSIQVPHKPFKEFVLCNKINVAIRNLCDINQSILNETRQITYALNTSYYEEPSSFIFQVCSSYLNSSVIWANCNLNQKIHNQIEQFNNTLIQNISSPLKSIGTTLISAKDISNLQHSFVDLARGSYSLSPTIFPIKNNTNKIFDYNQDNLLNNLYSMVDTFRKIFNKEIGNANLNLENQIKSLQKQQQTEIKHLNTNMIIQIQNKNKTIIDKDKIENRLNQTQLPFGKLPISLDESIAVFPIVLGIGFIFSSAYFTNSIKLRKEIHQLYIIKYKDLEKKTINKKISLIFPLWLDPTKSKVDILLKFIIFIIPAIIFIISIYYILDYILFGHDNEIIRSLFYYDSFNNSWFFLILYLFCIALFIYGISNTLIELRRYKI
jgi:hypothetical protein